MTRIIDCVQGEVSWWAARRGIPSASNFGRIFTGVGYAAELARWQTAAKAIALAGGEAKIKDIALTLLLSETTIRGYVKNGIGPRPRPEPSAQAEDYICELIADRAQLYPPDGVERMTSREMQHGIDTEPEARRWYEFEQTATVTQVGFCTTDDGRFGCSPDGLVGEDGLLELKCPSLKTQVRYLLDGALPAEYRPQVHGQLIVTGRAWVDFVSYAPGLAPLMVRVTPGDYTQQLAAALEVFWERYQAAAQRVLNLPAIDKGGTESDPH